MGDSSFFRTYMDHMGWVDEERFINALEYGSFELREATITRVKQRELGITSYFFDIGESRKEKHLHIKDVMQPGVRAMLGLTPEQELEGTVVQAFVRNYELHGFRATP